MGNDQKHGPLVENPEELPPLEKLGKAMRALPNHKMRLFVWHFVCTTGGDALAAVVAAGYSNSNRDVIKSKKWTLMHDERVLSAIHEESWRALHSMVPNALGAYQTILANPLHRDHLKAANQVLDRAGFSLPTEHKVVVERHDTVQPLGDHALRELQVLAQRAGLDPNTLKRLPAPPRADVIDAETVPVPDDDDPANW